MAQANPLLMLSNVRIVFPKLLKGQEEAFEGKGDPYYSASFLLSPDDKQIEAIKVAIREAAVAKYKDKADEMLKVFQVKDKLPIHDGAIKANKPYGGAFKGMLYVSARNNAKTNPAVAVYDNVQDPATGEARKITESTDPKFPYSGCYVNVFLNFFAYNSGGGEGVGASIAGVQFNADGERLAGGVTAKASDFKAVPPAAKAEAAKSGKGASGLFS